MKLYAALSSFVTVAARGDAHPSLPLAWTAMVNEAEVGYVSESYHLPAQASEEIPSATWTNFTDGSCQRLIYHANNADSNRYLLGCDAVDCCVEDQSGDHKEYQIPDVHPAALTAVHAQGQQTITLTPKGGAGPSETVTADVYEWGFGLVKTTAYVTKADDGQTVLHRWSASIASKQTQVFTNDYFDYKPVDVTDATALEAFRASQGYFKVPDVCASAMTCDNAHAAGKLTQKSLNFVKAVKPAPVPEVVV